uniref:Uncharacterized protein n=1 Tax=Anguilla anguilla TaxID=7936 RepID=A0A0E9RIV7_ANGAN
MFAVWDGHMNKTHNRNLCTQPTVSQRKTCC